MSAVSLRLPDELIDQTNRLAKQLNQTKTDYIRKAVESFNRLNEQRLFEQALIRSAQEVRAETIATLNALSNADRDGLND